MFRKGWLFGAAFALCAVALLPATRVWAATSPKSKKQAPDKQTPDEQAVLQPIQNLFEGLAKKDADEIRAQLVPEGSATLYRNGEFLQMSLSGLADRLAKVISSPDEFEERIHDPLIRIDDNIAVVWAPYEALRNGTLDHCGTNLFSLIRRDRHWLIASVTDNSRQNCGTK